MSTITRQRDIIDRRALGETLTRLAQAGKDKPRNAVHFVPALREALSRGSAEIRQRFDASGDGTAVVREQSFLMDQIIRAMFDLVTIEIFPLANPTNGERIGLVAVGGYGRGELAPYSDIDLLFLLPYKHTPYTEQVVEFLLYLLWDLGPKIGHSVRSVDECMRQAKADLTIRTALLESRYLWGEQALFDELRRRFDAEIRGNAPAFVEAKLAERDTRHRSVGDSRYQLEPNIKEGKGGLRDLHTLFWIAKYIYGTEETAKLVELNVLSRDESQRFERARHFLWTVRCHLHYIAGRPEERLTFDVQTEIGHRMGYTDHTGSRGVERFMKHYFLIAKDVGTLTRIFCAILETDQKRKRRVPFPWLGARKRVQLSGFEIEGARLTIDSEDFFQRDPVALIRLFHVAQQHDLDIHPRALRAAALSLKLIDSAFRTDPEANRLFLEILTSRHDPEQAMRRMNEAGVLGRFVPDFGRVVAQMQYDMYHVYTVDEHTLFAIGLLHKIETGAYKAELPMASSIMQGVISRRALYVATMLHDVAKGRGGDHSILGERIALKLGPRLGLSAEETETVAWLVRWHLVMSGTAFKFDIADPKTIRDFVERVQSPERLKLLLLLTIVDIRAVGPHVWNGWKAALLRDLYNRALQLIDGGMALEGQDARVAHAQAEARALLPDFDDDAFAAFAARGYPFYWLSLDAKSHARHARLMRDAEVSGAKLTVETCIDTYRAVTEITVYTADHAGLFSRIAGAFAVAGANIVDAKIMTMTNGMALDTFWIQDAEGGAFDRPDKLERLKIKLDRVMTGEIKAHSELARPPAFPSRTNVFTVAPRVLVDNSASATNTVIEVNGRDRPGLLHELTRALAGLKLQVATAKISTYGEKVVDVFYVKDLFGHKIVHPTRLKSIQKTLEEVLAKGNPATGSAAVQAGKQKSALTAAE